jgi:hypothetical protein
MSPSMTKFHGFFCNVRQIFCYLHIFLIKKYFSVISSVFDKTWQKQKSKNIIRIVQALETSEVWFECRESRKNVTCVSSFYPKYIYYINFIIYLLWLSRTVHTSMDVQRQCLHWDGNRLVKVQQQFTSTIFLLENLIQSF